VTACSAVTFAATKQWTSRKWKIFIQHVTKNPTIFLFQTGDVPGLQRIPGVSWQVTVPTLLKLKFYHSTPRLQLLLLLLLGQYLLQRRDQCLNASQCVYSGRQCSWWCHVPSIAWPNTSQHTTTAIQYLHQPTRIIVVYDYCNSLQNAVWSNSGNRDRNLGFIESPKLGNL